MLEIDAPGTFEMEKVEAESTSDCRGEKGYIGWAVYTIVGGSC